MTVERHGNGPRGLLDHRQVVPRWHSPAVAAASGEQRGFLEASAPRVLPDRWVLSDNLEDGDTGGYRAVEQEQLAFLLGKATPVTTPSEAVKVLRAHWGRASQQGALITHPMIAGITRVEDQARVHALRAALKDHPHQALLWSELSRHYVILGEENKAARAMEGALKIGAKNAYVTRAAVRLFTHMGDEERALRLIRRHPNVRRDPRLLSAEVALSSLTKVGSLHARIASGMIEDARFRPQQLADLTAALATVELESGKHKHARKLFEKTFPSPTENSLAQAQWASEQDTRIIIPGEAWNTPASFEAHALASRATGAWDEVVTASEQWLNAERFSLQPALVGSFASFSAGQNQKAEALASAGLQANPGEVSLYNNRAVARALLGRPVEALDDIREGLRNGGEADPYLIATLGLVAYRCGDFTLGASCYGTAIAEFVQAKDKPTLAYAILMWLRERAVAGDRSVREDFATIKPQLVAVTKLGKEPEVETMLDIVEADLARSDAYHQPSTAVPQERLQEAYAHFKPDRKSLSLRERLFEDM